MACLVSPSGQGESEDRGHSPTPLPSAGILALPLPGVRNHLKPMVVPPLLHREDLQKARAGSVHPRGTHSEAGFPVIALLCNLDCE